MSGSQVFLEGVGPLGLEVAVFTLKVEAPLTLVLLVPLETFLVFIAFVADVTQELLLTFVTNILVQYYAHSRGVIQSFQIDFLK